MQKVRRNRPRRRRKRVEQVFQDITAAAEAPVLRFRLLQTNVLCGLYQRANSKKASLYHVFQSAVEAVALFEDDVFAGRKLAKLIVRAEAFLFDYPNGAFQRSIICAFESRNSGTLRGWQKKFANPLQLKTCVVLLFGSSVPRK